MFNKFILILILFCTSCGAGPGLIMIGTANSKGQKGTGAKNYKYKCEKVGECCEVGKDCKEEKGNQN